MCDTVTFDLPVFSPIADVSYTLGEEPVPQSFALGDLVTLVKSLEDQSCGDIVVEFSYDDGNELDLTLFSYTIEQSEDSSFTVLQQSSFESVGQYFISYIVALKNYPGVGRSQRSIPFSVVIEPMGDTSTYVFNPMP